MLIVGTGGLAREVASSWELDPLNKGSELYFFDNINTEKKLIYDQYKVYHSMEEVERHFAEIGNVFIVCIANPLKRFRIIGQFEKAGGVLGNFICGYGHVVSPFINMGSGLIAQPGVIIPRDVTIGKGVFINAGAIVGHDSILGEYVSLGPGVRILGSAEIGAYSYIGCNTIILPNVKIGKKVRIGIGKIIDSDVPDNSKIM